MSTDIITIYRCGKCGYESKATRDFTSPKTSKSAVCPECREVLDNR